MKIVCPHCQAAYQVDIPGLKTRDVDVKCARCKSKFVVKKHDSSDEEENSPEKSVSALAGEKETASYADSKLEPPLPEKETPAEHGNDLDFDEDNKLDDYLDKILEEELGSVDPEATQTQSSPNIDSTIEEVDTDLDSLLNDLIDEGLQTDLDDSSDKKVEEPPAPEDNETYSEDLLGEIMSEEQQVESAPPSPTENQEAEVSNPEISVEDKKESPPEPEKETESTQETENPVAIEEDTGSTQETSVEEKPVEEKSDEDLWAEAFADQEATEQSAEKEGEETSAAKKEDAPEATGKSEEDLWAEAFAEQESLNKSLGSEKEPSESPDSETPAKEKAEATTEEEKSDEDLWAEAFADQEATEQSAEKADVESETQQTEGESPANKEEEPEMASVTEEAELDEKAGDAFDNMDDDQDFMAEGFDEEEEEEEELPEEAFSDDYNEEDFEFKPKKKLFSMPQTRTGKIIMAGSLMAIMLTAGGVYFILQTFAPPELVELEKVETLVPEGLTPNESAPPAPEQNPLPTPESITADTAEDTSTTAIEQELAQSEKLRVSEAAIKDVKNLNNVEALEAALSPRSNTVTIQTIMPVAYNINDIRVLSFNLEVVMDNDKTADVLRDALPVFEQLTLKGVEELLHKKFYNDVLYVKEKLQKKIRNDINAKLSGGGQVKKVIFKEFSIQ